MAKIPIILEPGRADGKLATSDAIFDKNKNMFQSEINDVQDTLTSDSPNKPLSAQQGKILKDLLDTKVIEVGAVPIDAEPIEGNITHVVNSDGLAKKFNKCNTFAVSNNSILNNVIKELYIKDVDFSQVSKIIIYKASPFSGGFIYGILMRTEDDTNVIDTRASTSIQENALSQCTNLFVTNTFIAVIDWSKIEVGSAFAASPLVLSGTCASKEYSPTINNYLQHGEDTNIFANKSETNSNISQIRNDVDGLGKVTTKFTVSNSSALNDVIKELYISDSSIISRISTIIIYKAFISGKDYITGFLMRDANNNNIIDTREAKRTEESSLNICTSIYIREGISVVIDWSKLEKNQYHVFSSVSLNDTVANLDFSPTIKSYINSSEISTLSASVDKINDVLYEIEEQTKEFSIADVTGIKKVGYYCDANGEIKSLRNAECTDRIFVNEGDLVLWSGGVSSYNGYYYGITAFDCNDNVIDVAVENVTSQDVQYIVKPNTSYIIASARNSIHDEYRYPLTVKVHRKIEPLSKSNKIRIHFVNNGKFEVFVPNSIGRCLKHEFLRQYNIDTIGSKTLVTSDVWYPSEIYLKSNIVIQGNLNFIYKLEDSVAGFENEGSHVGAGHGCEVMVSQKFFADGVEFVPTEQFNDIECDVFRIVLKANDYAIDTTLPGFLSSHALPKLDATGNPIVTAIHSYDAEYHVGNAIKCTNRLLIKRNGLKFNQLHGAMFQLQASAFSKISVGTSNFDTNNFAWNGTSFDVTPEDGSKSFSPSDPQYQANRFAKSKLLIGYGKNLCIRQEISNGIKDCYVMFAWYQESNNPRVKIYQMPVKTSAEFGSNADVFNDGDEICVKIERNIDL